MRRVVLTGCAILLAVLCAGLMLAGGQAAAADVHGVGKPAAGRGPFAALSALSDFDLTSVLPEPVSIILVGMVLLGCVAIVRRRMA